jgi:hypothetical protein
VGANRAPVAIKLVKTKKMNLQEAGIGEGISEVIVTTQSAVRMPNAAPIGILTEIDEQGSETKHFIKLYKGSQTLTNVLETTTLAANVTDDAVLFVKTALGHLSEELYLSEFAGVPVLTKANAWIVFTSVLIEERDEYLHFQVLPRTVKINRTEVKAINRGRNAVIEAAILATRFELATDEEEKESMRKQLKQFKEIVKKCGGRREKEAMRILEENAKVYQRIKV